MTAQVVTANRLTDGLVVYLDERGGWADSVEHAGIAEGKEDGAAILALAETAAQSLLVVGPYLMAVALEGGRPYPASHREVIRAKGPTVRGDLGKQAAQV